MVRRLPPAFLAEELGRGAGDLGDLLPRRSLVGSSRDASDLEKGRCGADSRGASRLS